VKRRLTGEEALRHAGPGATSEVTAVAALSGSGRACNSENECGERLHDLDLQVVFEGFVQCAGGAVVENDDIVFVDLVAVGTVLLDDETFFAARESLDELDGAGAGVERFGADFEKRCVDESRDNGGHA
jgi:hypothetical protein